MLRCAATWGDFGEVEAAGNRQKRSQEEAQRNPRGTPEEPQEPCFFYVRILSHFIGKLMLEARAKLENRAIMGQGFLTPPQ